MNRPLRSQAEKSGVMSSSRGLVRGRRSTELFTARRPQPGVRSSRCGSDNPPVRGTRRAPSANRTLGFVLAATILTLTIGYLIKLPCADGDWRDERQYRRLCYSDI